MNAPIPMQSLAAALRVASAPSDKAELGTAKLTCKPTDGYMGDLTDDEAKHMCKLADTMDKLEGVCTASQLDVIETIGRDAWKRQAEADAWDVTFGKHVAALHPTGLVEFSVYQPVARAIRECFGDYPAKCYRQAVQRMHVGTLGAKPSASVLRARGLGTNMLPTKGTGSGGDVTRGTTPTKWLKGVERMTGGIVDRLARGKCPKSAINGAALAAFADAVNNLLAAQRKLAKAINE